MLNRNKFLIIIDGRKGEESIGGKKTQKKLEATKMLIVFVFTI